MALEQKLFVVLVLPAAPAVVAASQGAKAVPDVALALVSSKGLGLPLAHRGDESVGKKVIFRANHCFLVNNNLFQCNLLEASLDKARYIEIMSEMGLSIDIDISAISCFKPNVRALFKFEKVEEFLNLRPASPPLSDRDRVKEYKIVKGQRYPKNLNDKQGTIILRATYRHLRQEQSICERVALMDWPEITKYEGLVSAQPHKQGIIDLRRTTINGGMNMVLLSLNKNIGQRSERIIFYRDGSSEDQFSHALLQEMDTIQKACAPLKEEYLPPVTFVVVQERHHTGLFPKIHGRHYLTDKSGNVVPVIISRHAHFTAIGVCDCVERERNDSRGQTAGALEEQIKVEIVYPHTSVHRVVNKSETIQFAVTGPLGRNSLIGDCYYKCNGRIWHGNNVISLSNICEGSRILVCPRLRGGLPLKTGDTGSGASSSAASSKLDKISLSNKIAELKATGNWVEKVDVPVLLRWPDDPDSVVMLGEDGRMILTLLLQCIERFHHLEISLQGKFLEENIFFVPLNGVLEIDSSRHELDAEGYRSDLQAIFPILKKHFFFVHDATSMTRSPMLVESLIAEIRMLGSEKTPDYFKDINRRSIIFSHPATLCSSARINIYTFILLHSNSLSRANEQKFIGALDPPTVNFATPDWLQRAFDPHNSSSPSGLSDVFTFHEEKYDSTFFSRLDFSRCLMTHALKHKNFSEKQVEAALYLLWPSQLPELHRRLVLLSRPTVQSTAANRFTPAIKTANTIDLLELFGSRR